MPPKPRSAAAPSYADLLAEANATYAKLAPLPLVTLRAGIDTTHTSWAKQHGLEIHRAETALRVAYKNKVLEHGYYRVAGERQPQWVYWPAGLPAPDAG